MNKADSSSPRDPAEDPPILQRIKSVWNITPPRALENPMLPKVDHDLYRTGSRAEREAEEQKKEIPPRRSGWPY